MIATRMLLTGQMTGYNRSLAWDMIRRSNDVAASVLWPEEGGPQLVGWIGRHYHIASLGAPNIHPGHWGNMHVTARGLVQFYRAVSRDPRVGPWLLAAMHHYQCRAWDGTDQCFGLPAVTVGSGIKQGWGAQSADNWADAIVNSTGFVDHNRYAVAILSEGEDNNSTTDSRGFNPTQAAVVTHLAGLLAPAGLVDTPARHNPVVHVDSMRAAGNTLTVRGWAFDPDTPRHAVTVTIASRARTLGHGRTVVDRPAVNRRFGLSGAHGFVLRVVARNGHPTLCVSTANLADGVAGGWVCRALTVDGRARGRFHPITVDHGAPVLTGWTSDRTRACAAPRWRSATTAAGSVTGLPTGPTRR